MPAAVLTYEGTQVPCFDTSLGQLTEVRLEAFISGYSFSEIINSDYQNGTSFIYTPEVILVAEVPGILTGYCGSRATVEGFIPPMTRLGVSAEGDEGSFIVGTMRASFLDYFTVNDPIEINTYVDFHPSLWPSLSFLSFGGIMYGGTPRTLLSYYYDPVPEPKAAVVLLEGWAIVWLWRKRGNWSRVKRE